MVKKAANEQKTGSLADWPVDLLTPDEMAQADQAAISGGVAGIALMRSAGRAVADLALELGGDRILVLAGPGNNGGDGLVAARGLADAGRTVAVALFGAPEKLSGDAALAFNEYHGEVQAFTKADAASVDLGCDIIIDALFGAGLSRAITGELADLIDRINVSPATVIAVDLPSGVNGASGAIAGQAVKADHSVTFFRLKPGHLLYPGRGHCGELHLAQIGIDDAVLARIDCRTFLNSPKLWRASFPEIGPQTHKYQRGHGLVVSGPALKTGASRLAATAALRIGAGLVTIAADRDAAHIHAAHLTSVMITECNSAADLQGVLSDARISAIVIGPAAGINERTKENILICLNSGAPVVLDADALTVFADRPEHLFQAIGGRQAPVVLTPHAGEFARLFPGLQGDRLFQARQAAAASGAYVVFKGADTIVAGPDGASSVNAIAPPWLATAGSGDVLAGLIAGLLAQGMPAFAAASAAVWFHSQAANSFGPGLIADDLPGEIPGILEFMCKPAN